MSMEGTDTDGISLRAYPTLLIVSRPVPQNTTRFDGTSRWVLHPLGDIRIGKVENHLQKVISNDGAAHLTLFDPEKLTPLAARNLALEVKRAGTAAAMVGGSTATSVYELDAIVKAIKSAGLYVILFPNDVAGLSQNADAVFFMSLLNSINPYYLSGAQALGAPLVKRYRLEPIPIAYLIVGEHASAAGFVGNANPIPYDKPELAAIYALAAEYLGMRFVYLEAGSGARQAVSPEMVRAVNQTCHMNIIAGGGIKTPSQAKQLVAAGASLIVTGTVAEKASIARLRSIIRAMH
jgi:phosphoglycerol geranylgeranyltransferase